jgi:peroxiredoxin
MNRFFWAVLPLVLASCKGKTDEKTLEVSGTITQTKARMIYLEELPMTTMERVVVDSAVLGKNGSYRLKAETGEARVYNLRLDANEFPLAAVINDVKKITLNATFNKESTSFPERYEVTGSKASQDMKDYMAVFNSKLQRIIENSRVTDSLLRSGGSDSALQVLQDGSAAEAAAIRSLTETTLSKSGNPALSMFILGYYQSTSNYPATGLTSFSNEEVMKFVEETAKRFPDHQGVIAIRSSLGSTAKGLVGQQAPEISLPDPNGKTVSLSSFRGKFVLVDFWASWCGPCRQENPNVVKAWNRFKGKNFTILGVSLDQPGQKDAWMGAVMEDKLTWTQVSDLKFWNSAVVPLYRIEGIPYNVLVDPSGTIIAESLRGEALEQKLAEVLE